MCLIPPTAVTAKILLENYLANQLDEKDGTSNIHIGQRVLHDSTTPVVSVTQNLKIDYIKMVTRQTFGVTLEPLMGQVFGTLSANMRETK
jgi:nitrogen-specific signal transduction histidine kinase